MKSKEQEKLIKKNKTKHTRYLKCATTEIGNRLMLHRRPDRRADGKESRRREPRSEKMIKKQKGARWERVREGLRIGGGLFKNFSFRNETRVFPREIPSESIGNVALPLDYLIESRMRLINLGSDLDLNGSSSIVLHDVPMVVRVFQWLWGYSK